MLHALQVEGLQGRAAATCSSSSSKLHDAFLGAQGTKTGGKAREDNRGEGDTEKDPNGGGCYALKGVGGGVPGVEGEGLEGEQIEVAMALKKEREPRQVLLSFMTSHWIKKPKEWNSWVGLPKELSKRQHEFQALLRLYVVSLMEKKIVDPLEGASIKNVIRYEFKTRHRVVWHYCMEEVVPTSGGTFVVSFGKNLPYLFAQTISQLCTHFEFKHACSPGLSTHVLLNVLLLRTIHYDVCHFYTNILLHRTYSLTLQGMFQCVVAAFRELVA